VSFVPLPVLDRTSEQAAIMLVTTVSFIFFNTIVYGNYGIILQI